MELGPATDRCWKRCASTMAAAGERELPGHRINAGQILQRAHSMPGFARAGLPLNHQQKTGPVHLNRCPYRARARRAAAITGKQGDCQPIASCSSSAYKESASKRTSTRQRLDYAKTL